MNDITIGNCQLMLGDCLERMKRIDNESIDLIVIDPPYYKVVSEDWDKNFQGMKEYVSFIESVIIECKRVLKPNGSLYIFGDDKNIAYLQVMIDRHLTLLNSLVWYKTNNQSVKAAANLRSYAPMTERILFYTPQLCPTGLETVKLDINNFQPLRQYFRDYQEALGLGLKQINEILGHRKAEHAFYWNSTQWDLPTLETYAELAKLPLKREFVRREYEFVRREYEALRREYEALRRPFNATADTFDVITGPIISQSENTDHPTTKPQWLISRLINASSAFGDVVLDPMMGSGTTGICAARLGRKFIGIEKYPDYFEIAQKRIRDELARPVLPSVNETIATPKQLELIA